MIDISPKEFEDKIRELMDGKTSRIKLAADLKADLRTLSKRIVEEISINNPDLYIEYIKRYPFKEKKRDDIDYEALVIEAIKTGAATIDMAGKYGIAVRTIQRKVNELEKQNPYLIKIYKEVKKSNKNNTKITIETQEKIDKLVQRPVKISELNETRIKQLEEIERVFNNRCNYMTKKEAAESMGMTFQRIYLLLNDLYRIRIEKEHGNMDENFRDSLKVELPKAQTKHKPKADIPQIEKEGEEK